jgi:hypothetical protein
MDDRGIVVRWPAGAIEVCLLQSFQTGSANHPASFCSLGRGCYFSRRVKRLRRKVDDSPPSSVEIKMSGTVPPLTHMPTFRVTFLLLWNIHPTFGFLMSVSRKHWNSIFIIIIIIITRIIIIIINCNWVITRWQWLFYIYTNMEKK